MTRDEAVAQVKLLLGFRTSNTADIEAGLRFQQSELEHDPQLPFFLKDEVLNLTCTADVERMDPPAGFLREWDEEALWVLNDENIWQEVVRGQANNLRGLYQEYDNSIPQAYAYDGQDFILFPTPDKVYTFRTIYYKADAVLSSNIENRWLANLPFLLIGRAGVVIAGGLRDQIAIGLFSSLVASETVKLNNLSTERDTAGQRFVIGGPD